MKIAAAILAAGASKRLGEPKQLVELAGERLLERAARVAAEAGCDPVMIVLGANAEAIQRVCPLPRKTILFNPDFASGIASSILAAVAATPADADGLLLMTCDQPAVTPAHLRRVVAAASAMDRPIGSRYAGKIGVPAYFRRERFAELRALQGDEGARALLTQAAAIDLPDGELDIDTPAALALARSRCW